MTLVYVVVGIFAVFVGLAAWFGIAKGARRGDGDSSNWDVGGSDGGHGGHHGGCGGGSSCGGGCGGGGD